MKNKNYFKLIVTIILFILLIVFTFYYGYSITSDEIYRPIPLLLKIVIIFFNYLPFIIYLLFATITYIKKINKAWIAIIISIPILSIYLIVHGLKTISYTDTYSEINPKYYSKYINNRSQRSFFNYFPKEIPKSAKKAYFYDNGVDTNILYYIDNNISESKINKKYSKKALWIGYLDDKDTSKCLQYEPFSNTPIDDIEKQKDFKIYLIECDCNDEFLGGKKMNYCNHGHYVFIAYNNKTHEIIYKRHVI